MYTLISSLTLSSWDKTTASFDFQESGAAHKEKSQACLCDLLVSSLVFRVDQRALTHVSQRIDVGENPNVLMHGAWRCRGSHPNLRDCAVCFASTTLGLGH